MRRTDLLLLCAFVGLSATFKAEAQERVVKQINDVGRFDNWCVREIKESPVIGGNTAYLYEFYGNPSDTLRTGKQPFKAPDGYLWRTNNVLAVVMGVVKTNNTVYPEKRGEGYCARIETHVEEVKALGLVNMDVVCQGTLIVGELPEPITTTKDPMTKVEYAIPFTLSPKCLRLDYKADVGHETIRGTGFSKLKAMGEPDYAEITMILQKRWEDEQGNVHALRVGTGIERIDKDIPQWINGHEVDIYYGNMTTQSSYKEYMGLKNDPETAYHTKNSKGQDVMVLEEGWAPVGTQPTHLVLHFISSCGKAFYGGVGNVLWIDNVEIVM